MTPILERDQLLNVLYITNLMKSTDELDQVKLLADLKDQAVSNHISKSDFNAILKMVKKEIEKANKIEAKNDSTCIPECIKVIPTNYQVDENGIFEIFNDLLTEVCPHLIYPVEILKDIDSNEERVRIAFKRLNKWNDDIIISKYDLATKSGIVKLSKQGIMVNDNNASYLVKWFCDIESANENNIPIRYCTGSLGYSKFGFIPYSADIVYNCLDKENKRRFDLYTEKGDKSLWLDYQVKCFDYTIPKIVIAGAYASLLLNKFGINPFGIHLWGETGKGKSVSILASASVYGFPDIETGIVYTGNATVNGIESRLAFVRNCTFYLDELSMLSGKQIDDMIYLIMQGQGKARMNKDGSSKNTNYWNCVSVSNSEMPITNDNSKGGIFNRIIQLDCCGTVFGDMDLKELANVFKNNYGFGAKEFIDLIEKPEIANEIRDLKKMYYNKVINNTEDKQANAASCILTSFEIARKYIYKTNKQLTPEELIPYLSTKDQISQVIRAYHNLIDWINANMIMFDNTELSNKQKWGCLTSDDYVNIYPYVFNEFCKTINIDANQFRKGLKQHNLIKCNKTGTTLTARINDRVQKIISVKLPVYREDEQKQVEIQIEKAQPLKDQFGNIIDESTLPF